MEQDKIVYEFRMGPEVFRFEAASEYEAEEYRKYALIHFHDRLGTHFDPRLIEGPERAKFPANFTRKVVNAPPFEEQPC